MSAKPVKMTEVSKMMNLFLIMQADEGVSERFNVVQAKWDLRDIMTQINDPKLVQTLIKFFFITSDSKTWEEFHWSYSDYLDRWEEYVAATTARKFLQQQTIDRMKDK